MSQPNQVTDVDRAIAYVKCARTRYVTKIEILDMIMVNAALRQDDRIAEYRFESRISRITAVPGSRYSSRYR
ncbi:hypothetical protein H257_09643 [Aphanomyces astaci]|uniref:Uncharacterized protein n=1 Tax=Aphanomyces astaci TaxID=112090 RepID=W4GAN6_APHAT|nr:hypothetical protein H257_09643 [Aphanomyces astaci]ETV76109.1 hypothetical protein H257_09643 [Aphanomyces astaci]|eukprot:XP_009834234.1 hypothetical protein H257_09643 [Aphanomyces astaci]